MDAWLFVFRLVLYLASLTHPHARKEVRKKSFRFGLPRKAAGPVKEDKKVRGTLYMMVNLRPGWNSLSCLFAAGTAHIDQICDSIGKTFLGNIFRTLSEEPAHFKKLCVRC